ncbi:sensor histidine kinase [Halalkalibacter okhensis]|uniref:histidine kinase n=1 Tax=Halalkalibacter okhensis TaxID=333138 RepID=A0A0B0IFA8_9BACI|nr:ATP-binding protein [Halalkalibacter okhensis]KHF39980.1 histidine kinase [Halalkalibacter okhensis]
MIRFFKKISFRSKILTILLLTTILLSSFSFILIQSIEQISKVNNEINEQNIPELVWISYWEDELHIKGYIVEQFLLNDLCCDLVDTYNSVVITTQNHLLSDHNAVPPESIEYLKTEMDLLDFKVNNYVQGLLSYGDPVAIRNYIEKQFLPHHSDITNELERAKESVLVSLTDHSNHVSSIINKSLYLLLFLTIGTIIISFVSAYRLSGSLTKPLEAMVQKVDRIANGEYGLTIQTREQIEFQQLTASINQMSTKLKDSFHTILLDKIFREQILNSLPVGIITVDEKTKQVTYNYAANQLLKKDNPDYERRNHMFWDILDSKKIIKNVKVPYHSLQSEHSLLVSQSELRDQHANIIGRIFYFVDITETEELEKRIHQSEKLALIGELAAGAAHEIRNPLAVIDGFVSLMNQSLSEADNNKFHMQLLMKELKRINSIIEELLLLTKPSAPVLNEILLEDAINEILPLIKQSVVSHKVEITTDLEPIPLQLDTKQMKQVFHNLIRNSIEALGNQGKISIYSKIVGDDYHVFIEDNGPGIPFEIQKVVFDPFLTSKENGTGLGLTIVQRIIDNHHGKIKLLSTSPKGTVFRMTLPMKKIKERDTN